MSYLLEQIRGRRNQLLHPTQKLMRLRPHLAAALRILDQARQRLHQNRQPLIQPMELVDITRRVTHRRHATAASLPNGGEMT